MNDTPEHILKKQFELYNSLSSEEKIKHLFDLTILSRKIITNRIKEEFPDISEPELKIELFKRFYRTDFDTETMGKIEYYLRNKNLQN
ncbi:MAG: hypothetical protein JW917_05800 [Ignavibacteria bacterium]|nr:hypothetical protein [Ignavibacteria bacterium]